MKYPARNSDLPYHDDHLTAAPFANWIEPAGISRWIHFELNPDQQFLNLRSLRLHSDDRRPHPRGALRSSEGVRVQRVFECNLREPEVQELLVPD